MRTRALVAFLLIAGTVWGSIPIRAAAQSGLTPAVRANPRDSAIGGRLRDAHEPRFRGSLPAHFRSRTIGPSTLAHGNLTRATLEQHRPEGRAFRRQALARLRLQALRLVTLPAHFWPFTRLSRLLAHGEPFTGLTPRSAIEVALANHAEGRATVIGRLAPAAEDIWTARESERAYHELIDLVQRERTARPDLVVSMALAPEAFGINLRNTPQVEREALAENTVMRITQRAREAGIGIELDVTTLSEVPFTFRVAQRIVVEQQIPVRLAIAARYGLSDRVLRDWVDLARTTGVRLGVRMVKGSYVEGSGEHYINRRSDLLARHRALITTALENAEFIDVGVATQNPETWAHAEREAARLRAPVSLHVIRGVNSEFQREVQGRISREYVSYGVDAPVFGLSEMLGNMRARRQIVRQFAQELD